VRLGARKHADSSTAAITVLHAFVPHSGTSRGQSLRDAVETAATLQSLTRRISRALAASWCVPEGKFLRQEELEMLPRAKLTTKVTWLHAP
jgi:hypothetical protein